MDRKSARTVVDVHAHHFPLALGSNGFTPSGSRWPCLVPGVEGTGQIMVGDEVFRRVSSDLWDVAERISVLDRAGIDVQVISPVPVMLAYWADGQTSSQYCRAVNAALAADVAKAPDRLRGLGIVPLQTPELAVAELRHAVATLGLSGVEIGSSVNGTDLDDPALLPFWAAAESLGAAVLIHPMDGGGGVVRRSGQPYDFGMGMLTDTSIAATALVFGGVLERFPGLRIVLAHGCGAFPWVYPRLRLADQVWRDGSPEDADARARSLWVDSLVLDPEHLRLLVHRFGPDKVLVGTDHPFFPDITAAAVEFVEEAADRGVIPRELVDPILSGNALRFLGMDALTRVGTRSEGRA